MNPVEPEVPPSYRDVAKLAGVSVAAVSMALRNRPGVSETTRAHIAKVAKQLGYRENPLVTALMTETRRRRKHEVRAIMGILGAERLDSAFYSSHSGTSEYLRGAQDAASEHGYALEQFTWKDLQGDMRSFKRALYTRRMVGLLLHLSANPPDWFQPDWNEYAVASVGNVIHVPNLDAATHDHFAGMQLALQKLHYLGHRRIGVILNLESQRLQEFRYLAAYDSAHYFLSGVIRLQPLLLKEKFGPEDIFPWVREQKPTAIISFDHKMIDWLRNSGIRIPEEVSFAHTDVDKRWKGIAGIEQNNFTTGSAAVELVITRINRNQYGIPAVPHVTMIEGSWVDGNTVRNLSTPSRSKKKK